MVQINWQCSPAFSKHMQVQIYAAARLSSEHGYLGYVLRGCGTDPFKTLLDATSTDNSKLLHKVATAMGCVHLVGNFFQIILILLVSVLILHKKGHTIARNDDAASSGNYGIFWGCVTVSVLGSVSLTAHTIVIVQMQLTSGVQQLIISGWMVLAELLLAIIASLMVAIYYGKKLNLTIPSIFLLPIAILCCSHAKDTNRKVVQCLSIWSLLLFLLHVCCRASFIFLALLARPPTVISATIQLIVIIFYLVHLLNIVFTFAKAKKNPQRKTNFPSIVIGLAQALAFMVVFATAICFGTVIGVVGLLANYGTIKDNPYSMLSTLATPLALAAFGWAMRKVGFQWLKTLTSSNTEAEGEDEQVPLLPEPNCKRSVNTNTGGEQVLQERRSTLMSCLMQ